MASQYQPSDPPCIVFPPPGSFVSHVSWNVFALLLVSWTKCKQTSSRTAAGLQWMDGTRPGTNKYVYKMLSFLTKPMQCRFISLQCTKLFNFKLWKYYLPKYLAHMRHNNFTVSSLINNVNKAKHENYTARVSWRWPGAEILTKLSLDKLGVSINDI